ncbi:MAG: 50S ribosomal protein L6, partial [Nitrospira bacterium SM23_35]
KQVQITLTGIDKQQIGQVAASLNALRPPDAYKGKGVRYSGQRLKLKVGKAGKK